MSAGRRRDTCSVPEAGRPKQASATAPGNGAAAKTPCIDAAIKRQKMKSREEGQSVDVLSWRPPAARSQQPTIIYLFISSSTRRPVLLFCAAAAAACCCRPPLRRLLPACRRSVAASSHHKWSHRRIASHRRTVHSVNPFVV